MEIDIKKWARKEFLFNLISRTIEGIKSPSPHFKPISIQLDITTKCNLKCGSCPRTVFDKNFLNKDMEWDVFTKIIPLFKYVNSVRLFGDGEPFLHKRFWDMHRIIKKEGAEVVYHTNGMLIDKELAAMIVEEGSDMVVFSIDSVNPELFNSIRNGAIFHQVVENLKGLSEIKRKKGAKKPILEICYTYRKSNLNEMLDIIELARGTGVEKIHFQSIIAYSEKDLQETTLTSDPADVEKMFDDVRRAARHYGIKVRLPRTHIEDKRGPCKLPWGDMYIRNDGKVIPCCYMPFEQPHYLYFDGKALVKGKVMYPELVVGDVLDEDIFSLWNNERYRRLRTEHLQGKYSPPCNTCYFHFGIH